MPNYSGTADAITAYNVGFGNGITSISENGNGIWAITYSPASAALLGYNIGGGEAIVARNGSNSAAALVGMMGLSQVYRVLVQPMPRSVCGPLPM